MDARAPTSSIARGPPPSWATVLGLRGLTLMSGEDLRQLESPNFVVSSSATLLGLLYSLSSIAGLQDIVLLYLPLCHAHFGVLCENTEVQIPPDG